MATLSDLSHDETLALISLLKLMIEADKRFGLNESAVLQLVAERVGRKLFNQLTDEARRRFPDRAAIQAHAAVVARPEARTLIYSTLREMALADEEVKAGEDALLRWLLEVWQLR